MRGWLVVGLTAWLVAAPAGSQPVFRGGIDLVHFGVSVVDRQGQFVKDLTADDFEIHEDGVRQTITFFSRGLAPGDSPFPLHLGLLFDTSASMEKDAEFSKTAAIKFLNTLTEAIDITLVDFDTEVRVARYPQAQFARLIERIRLRKADGWTALYDALGVYLDGAASQDGQKVLVLYTDGGDTRSALSFGDTMDLVRASDVTVYSIGFIQNQSSLGRTELRMRLQQVAEATGGLALFPASADELDRIYEQIQTEVRSRYAIGYASTNARADGTWRKVDVKLRARPETRDLRLRTRKGYFAPYREPSR